MHRQRLPAHSPAHSSPPQLQPGEAVAGGKRSIRNLWLAPARAFNKTAAAFESQRQLHMIRVCFLQLEQRTIIASAANFSEQK